MADGARQFPRFDTPANSPASPPPALTPPFSIEAEQQILGSLLTDNAIWESLRLDPEDFYDPVHADLWRVAEGLLKEGKIASPITMKLALGGHAGLAELGGPVYLVRLASVAISSRAAVDYAAMVRELRQRRDLMATLAKAQAALADPNVKIEAATSKIEGALLAQGASAPLQPVMFLKAATDAMLDVKAAAEGMGAPGITFGIPSVDKILLPMTGGNLVLLGGRPSMGKTAMALSIATRAAKRGHPVVFVSLEMDPKSMVLRALSEETAGKTGGGATPYADARQGKVTDTQWAAMQDAYRALQSLPVAFLPSGMKTPQAIAMGAKTALRRMKLDAMPLIVVDYLQIMQVPGASRFEQITAISLGLKDLAMSLGCPVMALSQLSRQVEQRDDKRPVLSDLRESGQLEQDADTILFAYREEYYHDRDEPPQEDLDDWAAWKSLKDKLHNHAELIVAKQRSGPIGTAKFRFNPALNLIWDDREWLV